MYIFLIVIFSFVCFDIFGKDRLEKPGEIGRAISDRTSEIEKTIADEMKELRDKKPYSAFSFEDIMGDVMFGRAAKKRVEEAFENFDKKEKEKRYGYEEEKISSDSSYRFYKKPFRP